jgi:hypothetical protein
VAAETLAHTDPLLSRFLHGYRENFWDWGDDPSFFAAEHRLGDVRRASWGVCRADVRKALSEGDLVVFFCARDVGSVWRYHFIGFGTVKALISRKELWTNPAYADYRSFWHGWRMVNWCRTRPFTNITSIGSIVPRRHM